MPSISPVSLRVVSQSNTEATLEVKWTARFNAKEIASHAVYDVSVFLQNVDGAGDLDIRRRLIGTDWVAAQSAPIEKTLRATLDRHFLNEDWTVPTPFGNAGDTTDEWRAEVVFKPFVLPSESKGASAQLRREFAP